MRTFLFTDIVNSTQIASAFSPERWQKILAKHDETLRQAFARYNGEVVKHTGDGFFVAFDDAPAAVQTAVEIQRALAEEGTLPEVRIGLHADSADSLEGDYAGTGVHMAARIAALAGPSEIVASRETADAVDGIRVSGSRVEEDLKGFEGRKVEVVSIDWR